MGYKVTTIFLFILKMFNLSFVKFHFSVICLDFSLYPITVVVSFIDFANLLSCSKFQVCYMHFLVIMPIIDSTTIMICN